MQAYLRAALLTVFSCICFGLEITFVAVDDDALVLIQQGMDYVSSKASDFPDPLSLDPLDQLSDPSATDKNYWKKTAEHLIEENRQLLDKVKQMQQENSSLQVKWLVTQVKNLQRELNTTQASMQDMRTELATSRAERDKLRISAFEVVEQNQQLIKKHDADAVAEKQWFQLQQDMSNEIDSLEAGKTELQQRLTQCVYMLEHPWARYQYGSDLKNRLMPHSQLPRTQHIRSSKKTSSSAAGFA